MNLCPKCSRSVWPFAVIFVITSIIAAVTWLILGLSMLEPMQRLGISLFAFVAVGGTLLHYVVSCLRRHCRHEHQSV